MGFTKISKVQARKLYLLNQPFYIVAHKLRPEFGCQLGCDSFEKLVGTSFETAVRNYEYYNCSYAAGYYAAFYVKD